MKIVKLLKSRNFWSIIAFAIGIAMQAAGHEITEGKIDLIGEELYNIASAIFVIVGAFGVDPKIVKLVRRKK